MAVTEHWSVDLKQLEPTVSALQRAHSNRISIDRACKRLRYLRPVGGAATSSSAARLTDTIFDSFRDGGENMTAEAIEAILAMLVRPTAVKIQPTDATWPIPKQCEAFTMLVNSVMEANAYQSSIKPDVVEMGLVNSVGLCKGAIDPVNSEIRLYEMDSDWCFWDDGEGRAPYSFYEVQSVPRRPLMLKNPGKKEKIRGLPVWNPPPIPGVDPPTTGKSDNVQVIEAWCVKAGETNGRHVIVAGKDTVLLDEPWEFEALPIAAFRYQKERRGFAGISLARKIAQKDLENKDLDEIMLDGLRGAVPWVVTAKGSKFKGPSDLHFQRVEYEPGAPEPKVVIPETVSPEIKERKQANREQVFASTGINPQLAGGTRPQGLNSEPAQRAFVDLANVRQLQVQERIGFLDLQVAKIICMLAVKAYKSKAAVVRAPGSRLIQKLKASDWNVKENQYEVSVGLTSGLNMTYAGRLADLQTLKAEGLIDQGDFAKGLNIPDTEKLSRRLNAAKDLAEAIVGRALNEGKVTTPDMVPDLLEKLVPLAEQEFMSARMAEEMGAPTYPKEHVRALGKVMRAARSRLKAIQAAQPPPVEEQPQGNGEPNV